MRLDIAKNVFRHFIMNDAMLQGPKALRSLFFSLAGGHCVGTSALSLKELPPYFGFTHCLRRS